MEFVSFTIIFSDRRAIFNSEDMSLTTHSGGNIARADQAMSLLHVSLCNVERFLTMADVIDIQTLVQSWSLQ